MQMQGWNPQQSQICGQQKQSGHEPDWETKTQDNNKKTSKGAFPSDGFLANPNPRP